MQNVTIYVVRVQIRLYRGASRVQPRALRAAVVQFGTPSAQDEAPVAWFGAPAGWKQLAS